MVGVRRWSRVTMGASVSTVDLVPTTEEPAIEHSNFHRMEGISAGHPVGSVSGDCVMHRNYYLRIDPGRFIHFILVRNKFWSSMETLRTTATTTTSCG